LLQKQNAWCVQYAETISDYEKSLRRKEKTVILKIEIIGKGESNGSAKLF